MATIITRETGATAKGSPLTNAEVDNNFINLNTEVSPSRATIRPALNLDFAGSESVDSRITVNRASKASYYDASGMIQSVKDNNGRVTYNPATLECRGLQIEEQRTNLFADSDVGIYSWTGSSGGGFGYTDYTKSTTSPAGTIAYKIASRYACSTWSSQVSLTSGTTYTLSWYQKFGSGNPSIGYWVTGSYTAVSGPTAIETLPNGWTRYAVVFTANASGSPNVGIHLGCWYGSEWASTDWNYYWGFQLEVGSFATSYIPSNNTFNGRSSSGTYFDSTGVLRTAATNQARYNYFYDTVKGVWNNAGLLLEGASTNNEINSTSIHNWAEYGNGDTYSTANATTAPDGLNTATQVFKLAKSGQGFIRPTSINFNSYSVPRTFSVFVKKNNWNFIGLRLAGAAMTNGTAGSEHAVFSFVTGTFTNVPSDYTTTAVNLGNGWYRISVSRSSYNSSSELGSNGYYGISFVQSATNGAENWDSTSAGLISAYVWGAQFEAGGIPSSFIYTSGSSATRSADSSIGTSTSRAADECFIQGSTFDKIFKPFNELTIAMEVERQGITSSDGMFFQLAYGSGNMQVYQYRNSNTLQHYAATSNHSVNESTIASTSQINVGSLTKFAATFKTNDFVLAANGAVRGTDTSGNVPQDILKLQIGYLPGYYKKFTYYPKRLANTELAAITA